MQVIINDINIKELDTNKWFDNLSENYFKKNKYNILLITTQVCPWCSVFKKVLVNLNNPKILNDTGVYQLNLDDTNKELENNLIEEFDILGVPTMLLFKSNEILPNRLTGGQVSLEELEKTLLESFFS